MPSAAVALALAAAGALLLGAGLLTLRASGARTRAARRLAGARGVRVGDLLDLTSLPERSVRLAGRIRCTDPILGPRDERLVAYHRDVELFVPGHGWRSIERLRESRTFELWDHDGSLPVDPAAVAEPLIVIPHVWRGTPDALDDTYRPAIDRLAAEDGPPTEARAVTRMVSVIDRLLVLAQVERSPDGRVALRPPAGGYLISALELDDAMRLLGGDRRLLLGGVAAIGLGGLGLTLGLAAAIASALASAIA
jgi:hypothetical protein